jgi:hypothetical protein
MFRIAVLLLFLAATGCSNKPVELSKALYDAERREWPFIPAKVTIGCEDGLPWVDSGEDRYALNGKARSRWVYADPILRIDQKTMSLLGGKGYQVRLDPGEERMQALALCH